jgi:hypothetical protein
MSYQDRHPSGPPGSQWTPEDVFNSIMSSNKNNSYLVSGRRGEIFGTRDVLGIVNGLAKKTFNFIVRVEYFLFNTGTFTLKTRE